MTNLGEEAAPAGDAPVDIPVTGPETSPTGRRPPQGVAHPLLRSWAVSFGVLFVAVAAWTFASPLGSAPDEPAHLIRAASLVRGELVGKPLPHATSAEKSTVTVQEPAVFASLATDVSCFQYKPTVPAGCQPPLNGSRHDVTVETYVGRYSPLYYVFVGLPTLALVSAKGISAARLVSGASRLRCSLWPSRRCGAAGELRCSRRASGWRQPQWRSTSPPW